MLVRARRLGTSPRAASALLALSVVVSVPLSFAAEGAEHGASPASLDAEGARRASSIARQTMSPFCPGRTLADCPSEYAAAWREDIRAMVARGLSAEQIQAELASRAGGDLSGIPHRDVGYGLPVALGLGAAFVLGVLLVRLRRKPKSAAVESAGPAPETSGEREKVATVDDRRLEAELEVEDDERFE